MKKLMFSALACVAFAFSGFASNEVVNEDNFTNENFLIETEVTDSITKKEQVEFVKTCVYEFKDKDGNVTGTVSITGVSDNVACNSDGMVRSAINLYANANGLVKL